MSEFALRDTPTSNPFADVILMIWGALVSTVQMLDMASVNRGLSVLVATLTIILLVYRISLAHIELVDETDA